MGRFLAAGLAVLFSATAARAIDPNRDMSQYVVERWGVERGFSRGPIYSIGQSGDGYLVIAKQNGLLRFDGFSFAEMHSPDVEPLLSQIGMARSTTWLRIFRLCLL
jgi:ligand-binding sensor domain-containing protein